VTQIGEGDARVGPPPSIHLAAGTGPATKVGSGVTRIPAKPGGDAVADATLIAEADDVQLVEVEILEAEAEWRIKLGNGVSVSRRYVWVVGSTNAETRQPWLDVVTRSLAFDALTGQTVPPKEATIANYGPGPLTIADSDGADLGSGFRLLTVTPRPINPNRRAIARLTFTAGDTTGTRTTTRAFGSSDPTAGETAGHDKRITLIATVRVRPGILEVIQPVPLAGTRFKLERPLTTVGRDAANDVVLNEVTVNLRHAEIRLDNGKFEIIDLHSENGVYVNKERVKRAVLVNGDLIQLGKYRLKFLVEL
jgi:hypothetical protein